MFYPAIKIFAKRFTVFFAVFVFVFLLNFQTAFARSYFYDLIDVKINVNQDSTFDVAEEQIFNYTGEYHSGWRSVSLDKTDGITDIKVIDGETGQALVYSPKKLDKLNPESWGRFTYYKEKGFENIEWYYNLSDTTYKWTIKYKVHGGIGFLNDRDELYWNIFTDYDAPVKEATVQVSLPEEVDYTGVSFNAYRTNPYQEYFIDKSPLPDGRSFLFEGKKFEPREDFTVQVGWPKGIVSQAAYWQDFFGIYIFYILMALITLANVIYIAVHWYLNEVKPAGRGTVIPQYAPPENLRPAMAEVLLKERITDKGWSATVIDLAVRGYIRIKEDGVDVLSAVGRFILFIIELFALLFALLLVLTSGDAFRTFMGFFGMVILFFYLTPVPLKYLLEKRGYEPMFFPKNYILEKIGGADESVLEDYEKKFLGIIFGRSDVFSTQKMKWASNDRKRELYEAMKGLEQSLFMETTIDTGAFRVGVEKEKIGSAILAVTAIAVIFIFIFFQAEFMGFAVLANAILINAMLLYVYLKYEARLSEKGFIMKEDWLGFKMYLETAERYRMQNLTPSTFEKYLPYAIIFGIEEKWGRAFESFNVQNPSWYSGAYAGGMHHHGFSPGGFSSGGGFSPAGFSASFSSSFSSAFSSAGGAGSSGGGGGGGGAGGGGGGGGGGAG